MFSLPIIFKVNKILKFLVFTILVSGFAFSASAVEVRKITRAPYTPQNWDLMAGIGYMSANTNLMLVDVGGSYKVGRCGDGCLQHIELIGSVGARDSQSHYFVLPGYRLQKNWPESSWSPYARIFGGPVHSIELQEGVRDRWDAGLAVGTYYYLHPKGDLRMEMRAAAGGLPFTALVILCELKFDETALQYKGITPEGI